MSRRPAGSLDVQYVKTELLTAELNGGASPPLARFVLKPTGDVSRLDALLDFFKKYDRVGKMELPPASAGSEAGALWFAGAASAGSSELLLYRTPPPPPPPAASSSSGGSAAAAAAAAAPAAAAGRARTRAARAAPAAPAPAAAAPKPAMPPLGAPPSSRSQQPQEAASLLVRCVAQGGGRRVVARRLRLQHTGYPRPSACGAPDSGRKPPPTIKEEQGRRRR